MRQVIFVGSPEGSSEESLAQMDAAIQKIREAADALRAALAEDRLADYLPPKRDEQREEIIRMARDAGLIDPDLGECVTDFGDATDSIHRFAALVAAAEREACADMVSEMHRAGWDGFTIAEKIRARGQE